MELIIVRHGESEADILKVIEGRADFPLTGKGQNQAKLLSKWIKKNEKINLIISSPLERAKSTAECISKEISIDVIYDSDLMEWDNGLLAGLTFEEADKLYPLPVGGRKSHHTIAETESFINFRARAEMFLARLKEKYSGEEKILLVSHGKMITMLFRAILGLPMESEKWIACGDTSIHKVVLKEDYCGIVYINKNEHLIDIK